MAAEARDVWNNMWEKHDPDQECDKIDEGAKIYFVNGMFEQFPAGVSSIVEFQNKDRKKSLCALYIEWLFGRFHKQVKKYSKFIDLRTKKSQPNQFHFFRAPGFFTNTLPRPEGFGGNFIPNMFLVNGGPKYHAFDYEGTPDSVVIQGIAFYYLQILPPSRQRLVYVNRSIIQHYLNDDYAIAPQYMFELAQFVLSTPQDALGITFLDYISRDDESLNHVVTLVFDSKAKRLEFYDSAGITPITIEVLRWLKSPFAMQLFTDKDGHRVCKIWANRFQVQDCAMDCGLWANVSAICRMSGISREQLPIKTSDQRAIMSVLREIMWTDCGLSKFGERFFKRREIDSALVSCKVPLEKKEKLIGLVMKHATKMPIPIPPDHQLCEFEQLPECDRVTINVQEVGVTRTFLSYVDDICGFTNVTVLLPDVLTYQIALIGIVEWMDEGTLRLELPTPVDLSDPYVKYFINSLLEDRPELNIMLGEHRIAFDPDLEDPGEPVIPSPVSPKHETSLIDSPAFSPTAPLYSRASPPALNLSDFGHPDLGFSENSNKSVEMDTASPYSPEPASPIDSPSYSRASSPALDLSDTRQGPYGKLAPSPLYAERPRPYRTPTRRERRTSLEEYRARSRRESERRRREEEYNARSRRDTEQRRREEEYNVRSRRESEQRRREAEYNARSRREAERRRCEEYYYERPRRY